MGHQRVSSNSPVQIVPTFGPWVILILAITSPLLSSPVQAGSFQPRQLEDDRVHRGETAHLRQDQPLGERVRLLQKRSVNFTPSWGKRSEGLGGPSSMSQEEAIELAQTFPNYAGSWTRSPSKRSYDIDQECLVRGVYLELLIKKLKVEMDHLESCLRSSDVIATPQQLFFLMARRSSLLLSRSLDFFLDFFLEPRGRSISKSEGVISSILESKWTTFL
eukprot:maker-scaffold130_size324016-snap-gene-0.15 protein:Tk07093 transcript:maker-scaffold130_size324016-snap-gene-0.15-mRNA-1 annotation:"mce related family protein"